MLTIGILLFHQVEKLDFVGPFEVLSYINKIKPASTEVLLIAKSAEPVEAYNEIVDKSGRSFFWQPLY